MTEKNTGKIGKTKETSKTEFRHDTKEVNGIRLHYVTAGEGEPLVLTHGSPQPGIAGTVLCRSSPKTTRSSP